MYLEIPNRRLFLVLQLKDMIHLMHFASEQIKRNEQQQRNFDQNHPFKDNSTFDQWQWQDINTPPSIYYKCISCKK